MPRLYSDHSPFGRQEFKSDGGTRTPWPTHSGMSEWRPFEPMTTDHSADGRTASNGDPGRGRWLARSALLGATGLGLLFLTTDPVLAASSGQAFCDTSLAETIKNFFGLIQFGGPLLGGVLAMGAAVVTPTVRQADKKMELKEIRNQAIVWGVIVAPLGTSIIQFILNDVVAGGASCGF